MRDTEIEDVYLELALIRCFRRMSFSQRKLLVDMASDFVAAEKYVLSLKDPPEKQVM